MLDILGGGEVVATERETRILSTVKTIAGAKVSRFTGFSASLGQTGPVDADAAAVFIGTDGGEKTVPMRHLAEAVDRITGGTYDFATHTYSFQVGGKAEQMDGSRMAPFTSNVALWQLSRIMENLRVA